MIMTLLALLGLVMAQVQAPFVTMTIRWNYVLPAPPAVLAHTGFQVQGCLTTFTEGCVMQDLVSKPVGPRQLQVQVALPASGQWLCVQVMALADAAPSAPSDRSCRLLNGG